MHWFLSMIVALSFIAMVVLALLANDGLVSFAICVWAYIGFVVFFALALRSE